MKATRSIYFIPILTAFMILNFMHVQAQQGSESKVFADKKSSTVSYAGSHPFHNYEGTSKDVSSAIMYNKSSQSISSVAVLIKVSTFDSHNANRDSHMLEAVDGIKYPQVTFSSNSISQEGPKLKVAGSLTFHGITRPINFEAVQKRDGNDLVVTGGFDLRLTDFAVTPPSLMGVSSKDLIKLSFSMLYILQ